MKKAKPITEHEEESLPFSFLKKGVTDEKIKEHWQQIKEKIKPDLPAPTSNDGDNNLV